MVGLCGRADMNGISVSLQEAGGHVTSPPLCDDLENVTCEPGKRALRGDTKSVAAFILDFLVKVG